MVQEFNYHREWVAALDKYEKLLIEKPDRRWEGLPGDHALNPLISSSMFFTPAASKLATG